MPLLQKILALTPQMLAAVIDRLAKEISVNGALTLMVLHGARALSELKAGSPDRSVGPKRGLKLAAVEMERLIETVEGGSNNHELQDAKHFCHYDTFRRILERERADNLSRRERIAYFRFLALLLIFLLDRGKTQKEVADSVPFRDISDFNAEHYMDRMTACSAESELDEISFDLSPTSGPASHLSEVLKGQFFVENPGDRTIASQFKTKPGRPSNYLCYRFTTRQNFEKLDENKITKSFLKVTEPPRQADLFTFHHRYKDEYEGTRDTEGVVLRLSEAFYLSGTSRRPDHKAAIGVKVIVIPSNPVYQRHNHDFMCGLFLSTDSALNPIVGRLLLVRTPDDFDFDSKDNAARIPAEIFIQDIHKWAMAKDFLKADAVEWLHSAIRNYEDLWQGRLNTSILSYRGAAKT
jgi:hypothetical protein